MKHLQQFVRRSRIDAPAAAVFGWHLRPGAFERLLPPGDGTRIIERVGRIEDDDMRVVLSVPVLGPVRQRWEVRHEGFQAGRRFCDVMERGPFAHWHHEHLVEAIDAHACELVDTIDFAVPGGAAGRRPGGWIVRARLEPMFDHRHAVTSADVAAIEASTLESPTILVEAGQGVDPASRTAVQLAAFLLLAGHDVRSTTIRIAGVDLHPRDSRPDARVRAQSAARARGAEYVVEAGGATADVDATDDVAAPRDVLSVLGHVLVDA